MRAPERTPEVANSGYAVVLSDEERAQLLTDPEILAELELAHSPISDRPGHNTRRMNARVRLAALGLYEDPPEPPPRPSTFNPQISQGNPRGTLRVVGTIRDPAFTPSPDMRCLADIQRRPVSWLWPGRLAEGRVTTIMGDVGDGKSSLIGEMASIVTTGRPWPGTTAAAKPGSVILVQAEEDEESEIGPRIDDFGGDSKKIHLFNGVFRAADVSTPFSVASDVEMLESEIERIGDVKLVFFDPIGSFITGISGNNDVEVRAQLAAIFRLAKNAKVAVVFVAHMNKNSDKDLKYRVMGSTAFVALPRVVWYLSQDPFDRKRRLLSLVKGNTRGILRTAIAFGLPKSRIVWSADPIDMSAQEVDDAIQEERRKARFFKAVLQESAKNQIAEAFILNALAEGPRLTSKLFARAIEEGIAESTFRRVLKRLKSAECRKVERDESKGPKGNWLRLVPEPDDAEAPAPAAPPAPLTAEECRWEDDGGSAIGLGAWVYDLGHTLAPSVTMAPADGAT